MPSAIALSIEDLKRLQDLLILRSPLPKPPKRNRKRKKGKKMKKVSSEK